MEHGLIVIGASWGGLHAVGTVLEGLGDAFREMEGGGEVMKILVRCAE